MKEIGRTTNDREKSKTLKLISRKIENISICQTFYEICVKTYFPHFPITICSTITQVFSKSHFIFQVITLV
jgi:hypothetical protein